MTQGQEGRKHQKMNEVWNLWWTFLHKIIEQHARKYHKIPGFHQHQYSIFWQTIRRKEKFVPNGSLTAWLLKRNRNAWKLQHYWNKYLTVKVKHPCIELSLLMKCGLETLNRSLNCSQTSGEVQSPRDPKNFDEQNRRSSKWRSLLMIIEESSWQILSFTWNKCDSSVLSWLDAKTVQKNAQKLTWLARGWATHFARQCTPAPGEGCERFV